MAILIALLTLAFLRLKKSLSLILAIEGMMTSTSAFVCLQKMMFHCLLKVKMTGREPLIEAKMTGQESLVETKMIG